MIVVNVRIEINAANLDAMKEGLAIMETASRSEEGCQDYTFSVEVNDPGVLRITEKWDSEEALGAHFQMPHMVEFRKLVAEYPPLGMKAYFYKARAMCASWKTPWSRRWRSRRGRGSAFRTSRSPVVARPRPRPYPSPVSICRSKRTSTRPSKGRCKKPRVTFWPPPSGSGSVGARSTGNSPSTENAKSENR